jgi:hypothetical protein
MSDRVFYAGMALIVGLMVALALVWPQGEGRRSPAPFGHAEVVPDAARIDAEREVQRKKTKAERAAHPSKVVGLR